MWPTLRTRTNATHSHSNYLNFAKRHEISNFNNSQLTAAVLAVHQPWLHHQCDMPANSSYFGKSHDGVFAQMALLGLHAAVSKKPTLAKADNSVLTSRVFHKLWGDFGLCASACSTSALAAHNFSCLPQGQRIEAYARNSLFLSSVFRLARDFGTQLKYSKLTQLAQKFCACRAIIGPNFIGSAYRKQRIYACEKENSSLTSSVFLGLTGDFGLCACLLHVTRNSMLTKLVKKFLVLMHM